EDVVDVLVFDRRVGRPGAAPAACDDHRDLARKIDKTLEDANLAAHPPPGFVDVTFPRQHHLAPALIPKAHGLQHRGIAEIAYRPAERGGVGNISVSGGLDTDRP